MSWARWFPAVVVAGGSGVATAHGLFEVAVASHVPWAVALTYPAITDGLALVAYSGTSRLTGAGARYAWATVVISAVISAVAQAAFLAGGTPDASASLRFAVGAWPAVACALVAHLLHLIVAAERAKPHQPDSGAPVARRVGPVDLPWPVAHTTVRSSSPTPPPTQEQSGPAAAHTNDETDQRVVALARRLADGEDLTGPAVASELGLGERSGRRLLADARTHLEQQQDPTPHQSGLHLVTAREETTA